MSDSTLLLKNAKIFDGTGNPWFWGDVAVKGDLIAAIGDLSGLSAKKTIDVKGKALAPGFVDIHTHADRGVVQMPLMEQYVRQGVTTILGGNCGGSEYPIGQHLQALEATKRTVNYGLFVGHGSIRQEVLGMSMRAPTERELEKMVALLTEAMQQGAFGMSLGLYYAPGSFAALPEIVALARQVGLLKGIISIHIRDESNYNLGLLGSIAEAINIARQASVPVHISHLKCLGVPVWGAAGEVLQSIEKARMEGLDISFDQYPYQASGTSITGALVPRWAQDGGQAPMQERLKDPALRSRIRAEMIENIERRGGPRSLQIANYPADPRENGKNLLTIGQEWKLEPVDVAIRMLLAGGGQLVSFNMSEEDIEAIMGHPLGLFASDSSMVKFGEGVPHPRYYGTFPRVLGHYVRQKKILSLEEAIRKMTSGPARRVGLFNRGLISLGQIADLVVFDPETIGDLSTFANPHHYNQGIERVIVGGQVTYACGEITGSREGVLLKKADLG